MELEKLTRRQLENLYVSFLEKGEAEKIKEFGNLLIKYKKHSIAGNHIPQPIYDFLNTDLGGEALNSVNFIRCVISGHPIEDREKAVKVYMDYDSYVGGRSRYVLNEGLLKENRYQSTCFDDVLGAYFLERGTKVIDKDFVEKTIAGSHARHMTENGSMIQSTISRKGKLYTTFPTNFYGYKQGPREWIVPEGDTLGIEIEMLFPNLVDKIRFSSWVGQKFPGWVCEYDGSLEDVGGAGDCGLELISPPLLYDDIKNQVSEICEKASELGGQGFQAGIYYGMHITVQVPKAARGNVNRATIASRYLMMFNDPRLRPFWQLIARRKGDSFSTYCPFQDIKLETCLQTERGEGERHPHRRAIYVRNPNLLETRIFRSNLAGISVRANLEICYLTMQFCKSPQFSLDNLRVFYDYLHANMSKDLKAILYRKKNCPIRVLNEIVIESDIANSESEEAGLAR